MPLDHLERPRLKDLHPLVDLSELELEGAPRISPPELFDGCTGYDPNFLGDFIVPWPQAGANIVADVLPIASSEENRLDYTHFSVTMSASRCMAYYVGVNIDGQSAVRIPRASDKWFYDGRIPIEQQMGEELYSGNLLDRGHLVRREDPNWGDESTANQANLNTFHFTNCSPQMAGFNQKTWLSLEDYLLKNAKLWKERVTVFSGPIFADDDLSYRGALIPSAFWKVVAFLSDQGQPSATAYVISQTKELEELEAAFGKFKTYQCSVQSIESRTGIDFGALKDYDGFTNEEIATNRTVEREVAGPQDILV